MKRKIITSLLAVILVITMMPLSVFAVETPVAQAAEGGLIVDKTATLEDDGTYTFNLEAFATGKTITITKTDPTDVVLVLDVSGSMDEDYSYITGQDWQFADDYVRNMPTDVYHKCLDGTYSTVTWTKEGTLSSTIRYTCNNCKATRKWSTPLWNKIPGEGSDDPWNLYRYTDVRTSKNKMTAMKEAAIAFVNGVAEKNAELTDVTQQHRVSIVKFADEIIKTNVGNEVDSNGYNYTQTVTAMTEVTADTKDSIVADINSLNFGGATAADKGLEVAKDTLSNSGAGRQKVVILLTDGDPNHGNGFVNSVASTAVTTAGDMKDTGVTIYTVGLVTGADPSDTTTDFNKYLNAVSNNYPNATVTDSSSFTVDLGEGGNNGYYKETKNSGSLADIFTAIQESIGTSTVTLDENAVLKDVVADGFVLPDSFNESNVTAQVVNYSGRDRNGMRVFATTGTALSGATVTFDKTNNTINVSGFDYADNCLIDGTSHDSNDFTAAVQGKKLVVTITGVEATEGLVTDEALNTNKMVSGVYSDNTEAELAAAFPIPQTILTSKAYVLDYAKKVTVASSDWGQDEGLLKVGKNMSLATSAFTENPSTAKYGDFSVSGSNLSFDPNTMKWDGFDTVYALGKTSSENIKAVSANTNGNVWAKLNFIPANNVYYEDDFVTTDSGKVGIVYSGTWNETPGSGNTETPNTDIHGGWKNTDLSDDTEFTDGSVHESSAAGATATFTFTGTGVDVYSKTTMTTGAVKAQLYAGEEVKAAALTKVLTVDNKSASGDYYQIPTVSFMNLDHGTYTVKLTVVSTSDARSTYYLDGIRVYNPLSEDNEYTDEVMGAYGDELGAVFTEVRDILVNWSEEVESKEELHGVVFIDEKEDSTGTSTSVIGEYIEYGPKNEVYLAKGQSIGFEVIGNPEDKVCVGIKAPAGSTTAKITNGDSTSDLNINASSDLYYEITPNAGGLVVIENTGDNLLSITKLKMTGKMAVGEVSVMSLLSYADTFDTLPVVDYEPQPEEPDVDVDTDGDVDNGGDVEIENPEVEEDAQQDFVVELRNWIKNTFAQLIKWLGR